MSIISKEFVIDGGSSSLLCLPVFAGKAAGRLEIHLDSVPFSELSVSAGETFLYMSVLRLPVPAAGSVRVTLCGDLPQRFFERICLAGTFPEPDPLRPFLHHTPDNGWCNDPNGLIYADGVFHLYHQYNPCGTAWDNMSWGHAESTDLFHWSRTDAVLLPDPNGMMFSGCAVRNDGTVPFLPQEAIIYFYTTAGDAYRKEPRPGFWCRGCGFTQNWAYSTDGGRTLVRPENNLIIGELGCEARDPKVFRNPDAGFFNMVLYLKENRFAVLKSSDLLHWDVTQELSFPGSWECPDLFCLRDPRGRRHWIFWSADGYYYLGSFDGERFHTDCVRHLAYRTALPYAAQTFSGTGDRVISLPWLRTASHGTNFTGMYGIPMEFSLADTASGLSLRMKPAGGYAALKQETKRFYGKETIFVPEREQALEISVRADIPGKLSCSLCGCEADYDPLTGVLRAGRESAYLGADLKDFTFYIDRGILEVLCGGGLVYAAFDTGLTRLSGPVRISGEREAETVIRAFA